MKDINIFCFGFGQVAKNFIKKLIIEKYNINLSVTSRNESSKENFKGINYNSYLFNSEKFDKNLVVKLKEADHILVSIPPKNEEDLVVKNFSEFLESSKVKWITYLKNLVQEHYKETNSDFSKKIIENFDKEISNFIQVCPKEMIDKLKKPISLNSIIKEVS